MQSFSISDIELLTGIKAHTLRVWEKRYDFFKASRTESRQRFYANEDLKTLLCVSFLYHNGWKISRINKLSHQQLTEAVSETTLGTHNYTFYEQRLLQAAIDFNEAAFVSVLNQLTVTIGVEKLITEVCYPYLRKLGLLWNSSKVIPAQEHFSSYLIQSRLITETEKYSAGQAGSPEIILFCPENEHHELPLLYLNYLLRKNGWKVLYLGANIKLANLKQAANLPGIRLLYLHLIVNFTGYTIDDYFETLQKSFPDKIIVASGRGVEHSQRTFVNFQLLRRDDEIHHFVESRHQILGST